MSSKWRRRWRLQSPTTTTSTERHLSLSLSLSQFSSHKDNNTYSVFIVHRFNVLFGPLHCIKAKNALILLCLLCSFSLHKQAKIIMQLHRGEKLKLVTVYIVQSAGCGLRTADYWHGVFVFSLYLSLSFKSQFQMFMHYTVIWVCQRNDKNVQVLWPSSLQWIWNWKENSDGMICPSNSSYYEVFF